MILVPLAGATLGWPFRGARAQREAVAAIEKAGGTMRYDFESEWINSGPRPDRSEWFQKWLDDHIGVEYLCHVVGVVLPDGSLDFTLGYVAQLTHLEELKVRRDDTPDDVGLNVIDAELIHLQGLSGLRVLDLSSTEVSDVGLMHLSRLTGLQSLDLSGTRVTNAGLTHLKGLTSLRTLDLLGTTANDFGAQEIRRAIPGLRVRYELIRAQ
jgi:hypothetical protein